MCFPAGLFQLRPKRFYFNPLLLLETEKAWKGRKENSCLRMAGVLARIWAAVGAQDPTHVSQLCHWKSGIKLSKTVISVLESCITLFRHQACREYLLLFRALQPANRLVEICETYTYSLHFTKLIHIC